MLTTEDVEQAQQRLQAAINAYLDKALPKFIEIWRGELIAKHGISTQGDCLYCQGMVTDLHGETYTGVEHLHTHMQENYIPTTLMLKATKTLDSAAVLQHIMLRRDDVIRAALKAYLLTALAHPAPPMPADSEPAPDAWVAQAREALTRPSNFGYFGHDDTLWKTSAPTWSRHRDSENLELANFSIVESTLIETFPHLVTTEVKDEATVLDDYDEEKGYPQIYIFKASHWAVGWVEQIVVPVFADPTQPLSTTNLHPAYRLICELAEKVMQYPFLDGAETIADEMDQQQELDDAVATMAWLTTKDQPLYTGRPEGDLYPVPTPGMVVAWCHEYEDGYYWSADQVLKAVLALAEREAYEQAGAETDTDQLTLDGE